MLLPKFRRMRRRFRPLFYIFLGLFALDAAVQITSRPYTTQRIPPSEPAIQGNYSVFVVSIHRNTEPVLRSSWNSAVLGLADYFGPERMYFSAIESGSQDGTKKALMELQAQLKERGVGYKVELGMGVHEQTEEINNRPPAGEERREGWIWNQREKKWDVRRIPYLAAVRNQAMEPLWRLEKDEGKRFDRVLWVNDVVFDTEDIVTLLNTRSGSYAAACTMDYKKPPSYYDTFALRDSKGDKGVSEYWPWFHSSTSRAAAQVLDPVPVASCWNGIVAFDARPFYSLSSLSSSSPDTPLSRRAHNQKIVAGGGARAREGEKEESRARQEGDGRMKVPPKEIWTGGTHQESLRYGTDRLLFRGIPDTLADLHLEGSECCLIHADNPLSGKLGVWLNPNVRVGYDVSAYRRVRGGREKGKGWQRYPKALDAVVGTWADRGMRLKGAFQVTLEKWTVMNRIGTWVAEGKQKEEDRHEAGYFCLINEMQIMWSNGWKHL